MTEVDFVAIADSAHDVQNPVSRDKLRLTASYLAVAKEERVLDIGCGRGWWPTDLAVNRGADVTALEINEEFAAAATERAVAEGVPDRVLVVTGPAADFPVPTGSFDVVTCLGATFALGGYRPALAFMSAAVRGDGRIAIGEVHASEQDAATPDLPSLGELTHIGEEFGLELTGLVSADVHDWDHYESRRWAAVDDWASRHPDHPQRSELLARTRSMRNRYLTVERGRLGWSVLVFRLRPESW